MNKSVSHDVGREGLDDDGWVRDDVFEGGVGIDVLILDRVWLDPLLRGRGLGLVVVSRLMATFGRGCAGAVLFPAPVDREIEPPEGAGRAAATARLAEHWAKLGFGPSDTATGVWTFDLAHRLPNVSALL